MADAENPGPVGGGGEQVDAIRRAMFRRADPRETAPSGKVSVVGCGHVGSAVAFALCLKDLCSEIAVVDVDQKRLEAELADLQHAAAWSRTSIHGGTDIEVTKGSQLCIVTATAPRDERHKLLVKNVEIFKSIIPQLVQHSPDCVLLVVTNPVETMTYVAWKLSGLPTARVLGAGTVLESVQFRRRLSTCMGVHPSCIKAVVSGAHEDILVFNLSGVHISGVPLKVLKPNIHTKQAKLSGKLKDEIETIISGKGYNSWGVALSVVDICRAILQNSLEIMPVASYIKGCRHSETPSDVFMSAPCVVGERGAHSLVKPRLGAEERALVLEAAKHLLAGQLETGV